MGLDPERYPLESTERARELLRRNLLEKALKTTRNREDTRRELADEFQACTDRLVGRRAYGNVLSALYKWGPVLHAEPADLIRRLSAIPDHPGVLKHAYRFGLYSGFEDVINSALKWHAARNATDAEAWARKFDKLRECASLETLSLAAHSILDEESAADPSLARRTFTLRAPLFPAGAKERPGDVDPDDEYVVSRTARVKMERAVRIHSATLSLLRRYLASRAIPTGANQLIDLFAELPTGLALFEVKSITQANEREQVRHAASQLYEYRFLHGLEQASLWVVTSEPPSAAWIGQYLTKDRGIRLIWPDGDGFGGPSAGRLL